MADLSGLNIIFNNVYILYTFALGIWAALLALRNRPLSGQFWGAMWLASIPPIVSVIVALIRTFNGEQFRAVFWLYQMYFIIVLPGTFALLRGRDDVVAARIFAGVSIFSALAAMSIIDSSRHIINPTWLMGW